jgi:hypothetical protein
LLAIAAANRVITFVPDIIYSPKRFKRRALQIRSRAATSAKGHERTLKQRPSDVRFVPRSGHRSPHSITSVAVASSVGGAVMHTVMNTSFDYRVGELSCPT